MQNRYIIRIHSFVDLITNSSTELFVAAGDNTIKSIKEIIDSVLKMGGSTLSADDLFTFELVKADSYHDYYENVSLTVKAKNDSPEGLVAAKLLSNLTSLFSIESEYNG